MKLNNNFIYLKNNLKKNSFYYSKKMKSLLFTLFGIIAFFSPSLAYDCKTEKMTQLCLSPAVEQCYNCVKNVVRHDDVIDHKISVCVPVFHNQLGALENYPSKVWNCTMFRHEHNEDNEHRHPIDPVIIDNDEDNSDVEDKIEDKIDNDIEDKVDDEIDQIDDIVDMIFDSLNHNIQLESVNSEGLYPACSGPICSKEGWQFQKSDFGKDWCGLGDCKPYGRKYYCSFPTNCAKKTNAHEFETLGCGSEKFKCMLKKSCRNLVKQFENCDQDMVCAYGIISGTDNESFLKLVKCMLPN